MACPFKIGDLVVFTNRSGKAGFPGHGGLLDMGDTVRVSAMVMGMYLKWEAMGDYPGGALH